MIIVILGINIRTVFRLGFTVICIKIKMNLGFIFRIIHHHITRNIHGQRICIRLHCIPRQWGWVYGPYFCAIWSRDRRSARCWGWRRCTCKLICSLLDIQTDHTTQILFDHPRIYCRNIRWNRIGILVKHSDQIGGICDRWYSRCSWRRRRHQCFNLFHIRTCF